jgi:hypothetical protein
MTEQALDRMFPPGSRWRDVCYATCAPVAATPTRASWRQACYLTAPFALQCGLARRPVLRHGGLEQTAG